MKNLKSLTVLFFVSILLQTAALAATPAEIKAEIQNQISQRHPNPPEDFWEKLGPDAVPVIKQMYKESNDAYAKSWLVDGMGHFDDPEITSILKSQIASTDNEVLKKSMLSSLIRSQGDGVYDDVEPYLKDKDPHIRLAVATGLRDHADSERARKRLEEFNRQEKVAWIKEGLKQKKEADLLAVKKTGEDERITNDAPKPSPTPLPEKAWAGEWKGAYITPKKNTAAIVNLTLLNEKPKKDEAKWKIDLKLPKQARRELREKDVEIVYYQTASSHWVEVRNKKDDSIFIGQRKTQQ
jgi:hypothetical protein